MTAAPQGWYPDPSGGPEQRWWDGQQWTGFTAPAAPPAGAAGGQPPFDAGAVSAPFAYATPAPAAPRFASAYATFWQRVAAFIIDWLILAIPTALIFIPLVGPELIEFIRQFADAIEADAENPELPAFTSLVLRATLAGLLAAIVSGAYFVVLIAKRGATVGMSLLRIHVVAEDGSKPSWGRSLARWGVVQAIAIAGNFVPVVGGLLPLLDNLWMLWDEENQTLHDKAASTWVLQRPTSEAA